jgi:hypothetical protein
MAHPPSWSDIDRVLAHVGFVGFSHGVQLAGQGYSTPRFTCSAAPSGAPFLPELIDLAWNEKINPVKAFDLTLP